MRRVIAPDAKDAAHRKTQLAALHRYDYRAARRECGRHAGAPGGAVPVWFVVWAMHKIRLRLVRDIFTLPKAITL
jgi:hypothetical protein